LAGVLFRSTYFSPPYRCFGVFFFFFFDRDRLNFCDRPRVRFNEPRQTLAGLIIGTISPSIVGACFFWYGRFWMARSLVSRPSLRTHFDFVRFPFVVSSPALDFSGFQPPVHIFPLMTQGLFPPLFSFFFEMRRDCLYLFPDPSHYTPVALDGCDIFAFFAADFPLVTFPFAFWKDLAQIQICLLFCFSSVYSPCL